MAKKSNSEKINENIELYEETITEFDEYTVHLNKLIEEKDTEIEELEHKIKYLIQEQEKELKDILKIYLDKFVNKKSQNEVTLDKEKLEELNKRIEILEKANQMQKSLIGRYRSSVVYPFFKMSSMVGNTSIGKVIQKIIK
jgi:predicted RNase H-like nuclease (RuvC/YqgF family)